MKKRHLLQTGGALVGLVALFRLPFFRSKLNPPNPEAEPVSNTDFEITKTKEEWREILGPKEFAVLREHDTEPPFSSPLDKLYAPGIYNCAGCQNPVYLSETKFDSGIGWPSFYAPIDEDAIGTSIDNTLFMTRTEVHCDRCGGHLGHIFNDGPEPTGKRHCLNGIALEFTPAVT